MATIVKVVSVDMRQASIKVTPATYLTDVLEQACKKFNLTPDKYLLKHKEKELDLSNNFRNAGLVAGAKLELITKSKTPGALNIALQLPEPEAKAFGAPRATAKLPSDTTVWKVLRHFESAVCGGRINITARGIPQTGVSSGSGQLYYESPNLQVESRSLSSFVDFQKTMSQLGYNKGNVLIRLSFQKTEKTFVDATNDISQYFEEEASVQQEREAANATTLEAESQAAATSNQEETPQAAQAVPEAAPTAQEPVAQAPTTAEPSAPEPMEVDTPSDPLAPTAIFSAPTHSTPAAAHTVESDEVYVPGIQHAQLHQQRLKTAGMNKRLLSDREIQEKAAAEEAKLAAVKSVDVRVRFPDQTLGQWKITPDWTGHTLYKAIRDVMAHKDAKFHIVVPGQPVVTIKDDEAPSSRLVKGYGFRQNTLVNLVWDNSATDKARKEPFLKAEHQKKAVEVVVPEVPQGEEEDEVPAAAKPAPQRKDDDGEGKRKGVPKWLKLGKK
ncbi:UBX domain-containing protein [Pestalotiopsis sp. NC0098]|nr:UBX domain-containing protein [Pestalotiopsis sp. NC0098]